MRRDYFIAPRIPFWPPSTYTAKELMEAIRKIANSSSRGHKNIQPVLNDTREPYVVTEEDKGRRKGRMGETSGKTVNEPSLLPMFSNEYLLWLRAAEEKWAHKTTPLTLLWLFIFLHFVSWDTSYVLLGPRSLIGGDLHCLIFVRYALYSSVDYFYEFPAYSGKDGFTSAQSSVSIVETLGYLIYMAIVWKAGTSHGPSGLKRKIERSRAGGGRPQPSR